MRRPGGTQPSTFTVFPRTASSCGSYLESSRFLHPVFREFYKERDVVREERRMRMESDPQGKLMEADSGHRVRSPSLSQNAGGGWPSDIDNLRVEDAEAFFDKYYVPGNITIGDRGRRNPADARRWPRNISARIPKQSAAGPVLHGRAAHRKARSTSEVQFAQPADRDSSPTSGPTSMTRTTRFST